MSTISFKQFARKMADSVKKLESDKAVLPKMIGNTAANHFQNNFRNQGFDGNKWEDVQRRIPGTKEYKYPKSKGLSRRVKAILVGAGTLKRSIGVKSASWSKIVIWANPSEAPYAVYHNEGTKNIPKREFMGKSKKLTDKITKLYKKELRSLL